MRRSKGFWTRAAMAAFLGMAVLPAIGATGDKSDAGPVVAGTWEHHHASFSYFGITSLYSCSGLETNISQLLRHLGARKDLTVRAIGCPHGFDTPGRDAIVELDFYSLSPSADANAANTVQARWTPVQVTANRPSFIGRGDCELIDEMKDILSKNFSLRDLNYRADCVPGQVNINDFSVKAEVLKPLAVSVANARAG
ncbi:MAG TPA: hypothetical protein VGI32_02475 [Steroidobacteraceae bacterium]|jgi:hypothetical protein